MCVSVGVSRVSFTCINVCHACLLLSIWPNVLYNFFSSINLHQNFSYFISSNLLLLNISISKDIQLEVFHLTFDLIRIKSHHIFYSLMPKFHFVKTFLFFHHIHIGRKENQHVLPENPLPVMPLGNECGGGNEINHKLDVFFSRFQSLQHTNSTVLWV